MVEDCSRQVSITQHWEVPARAVFNSEANRQDWKHLVPKRGMTWRCHQLHYRAMRTNENLTVLQPLLLTLSYKTTPKALSQQSGRGSLFSLKTSSLSNQGRAGGFLNEKQMYRIFHCECVEAGELLAERINSESYEDWRETLLFQLSSSAVLFPKQVTKL